jgi:hypothetical protein
MYEQSSKEGIDLQSKMDDGENIVKKMLSDKWQQHSRGEETDPDSV